MMIINATYEWNQIKLKEKHGMAKQHGKRRENKQNLMK